MLQALPLLLLAGTLAGDDSGEGVDGVGALVRETCAGCHGGERPKGRLDLGDFDEQAGPELVRDLLEAVRSGDMPPPDEAPTTPEVRAELVEGLSGLLAGLAPDPGRPTLRRLNRYEYGNSVRALLGIEADVEQGLPEDPSSEGFDNQGDVMFITPELAELYLDAGLRSMDIFLSTSGPGELAGADNSEEVVARFLERAFRRPATEQEIDERARILAGEDGIRAFLTSVLISPHFLFRVEEDRDEDAPWRISTWELATRLSYFLWSAPPDGALRDAARDGSLHDPVVLQREVERLLDDGRSEALATRFAGRWLGFADMPTQAVDVRRFKGTNDALKRSMVGESVRFFDALVRDDRSLLELVDADYTFLNGTLARHYGIDGVTGNDWVRFPIEDRRRGGVLTQASILTITSQPLRTNPVVRGAWILDRLLGTPPPPPPPDAGVLPADDQLDDGLTLRQRLELHRADPTCAACHARIDPLGFALESYDGIGRWRDKDHLGPIDATGTLPDGREISGILGLKDALVEEPDRLARGVARAVLVYAIGRPLEPVDEPVLDQMVLTLREEGWRMRSLVHLVVESYPFQNRRSAR